VILAVVLLFCAFGWRNTEGDEAIYCEDQLPLQGPFEGDYTTYYAEHDVYVMSETISNNSSQPITVNFAHGQTAHMSSYR